MSEKQRKGKRMNNKSFNSERIAAGYANDRPFIHADIIKRMCEDLQIQKHFQNGLDVGCGAGLSTKALKMICEKVTGTDISEEMVKVCRKQYSEPYYHFYPCQAEETEIPVELYDIVSAAGMINWVDENKFLSRLKQILKPDGILLIYDFCITDKMCESEAYTNWWHNEYLKNFPKPVRKENIWTDPEVNPYGFEILKQVTYSINHTFSKEAFIRFMMLQSNVNVQIEEKRKTQDEIRTWFQNSLGPIFKSNQETLVFDGYSWYLKIE